MRLPADVIKLALPWAACLTINREELVVVGWTDPTGSRPHIGALLVGYYTDDGRQHYAGRAGTGMTGAELKRLFSALSPLQVAQMPLDKPRPRDNRFGSALELARAHRVRPEVVVEVTYLNWTDDNLLRQVAYQGQGRQAGTASGESHSSPWAMSSAH
jgi:ATP-dependent DNA ligase